MVADVFWSARAEARIHFRSRVGDSGRLSEGSFLALHGAPYSACKESRANDLAGTVVWSCTTFTTPTKPFYTRRTVYCTKGRRETMTTPAAACCRVPSLHALSFCSPFFFFFFVVSPLICCRAVLPTCPVSSLTLLSVLGDFPFSCFVFQSCFYRSVCAVSDRSSPLFP